MTEPAAYLADPATLPALMEAFSAFFRIGYSETAVRERLGLPDITSLLWRALPIYRDERLGRRDPLDLAIDLFLLQGSLTAGELSRLFTPSSCEALFGAGLLDMDASGSGLARARASLFPVGRRLVFSDHAWPELPHPGLTGIPYEQVMFVGSDSRHLARCTIRRPVGSALDLCTGSGVQAILAAAHSKRVLAVDINPRAVECARFNAQISGVTNLEVALGDLFEPARGQRFDLIMANPPFVPSPLDTLRFRDGGRSGEDIQRRIVEGLPQHLAPGGMAQIITELGERDGEPLSNRLRDWIGAAPIDIHVLRLSEYTAEKYAIGHSKGDDYATFLGSVQSWAANLRDQNYARVVSVLISFQWSDPASGPPWERSDQCHPPLRSAGAEIDAIFQAERLARRLDLPQVLKTAHLRRAGPIALLDARLLGGNLQANAKATLLGQPLSIEYPLDPLEREILNYLENPTAVSEILNLAGSDSSAVIAAIASLLRRRLVNI